MYIPLLGGDKSKEVTIDSLSIPICVKQTALCKSYKENN